MQLFDILHYFLLAYIYMQYKSIRKMYLQTILFILCIYSNDGLVIKFMLNIEFLGRAIHYGENTALSINQNKVISKSQLRYMIANGNLKLNTISNVSPYDRIASTRNISKRI